MKHIFTSMVLLIAKIVIFVGFGKPTCDYQKTNAPTMCHCLVRILDRKHHRPYFFENEAGQTATVNGARYRNMITQFFLPKLDDIDVANMWFQQDNATCYIANETIQLLHETFPNRIFSLVSVIRIGPLDHVI